MNECFVLASLGSVSGNRLHVAANKSVYSFSRCFFNSGLLQRLF